MVVGTCATPRPCSLISCVTVFYWRRVVTRNLPVTLYSIYKLLLYDLHEYSGKIETVPVYLYWDQEELFDEKISKIL